VNLLSLLQKFNELAFRLRYNARGVCICGHGRMGELRPCAYELGESDVDNVDVQVRRVGKLTYSTLETSSQ